MGTVPRNPASLALTDRFRADAVAERNRTARSVADLWRMVNVEDLEGSIETFVRAATREVRRGQAVTARESSAYLARFLASELDGTFDEVDIDAAALAGRTIDGRDVSEVLEVSRVRVAQSLRRTRDVDAALGAGLMAATRCANTEVMDACRSGLQRAMSGVREVVGWRRAYGGDACPVCLALADGTVSTPDRLPDTHPACRCIAEPSVTSDTDSAHRPTGAETFDGMSAAAQDALFAGRGGNEKGTLLRSGAVALGDLVQRRRPREWRGYVEERPLSALR